MSKLHIITPVKDSLSTTLRTIESVMSSSTTFEFDYTVYNDFSADETTVELELAAAKYGFKLVNLKDITDSLSPNYLLVLQIAQKKALQDNAHLVIIESDVIIKSDTVQQMYNYTSLLDNPGMIAAVTTDYNSKINFPYLYAQKFNSGVIDTSKRLSFCCTLLCIDYLKVFNFGDLNPEKAWYDVFISHKSVELGFRNYLLTLLQVTHFPHSSRPWKQLKYKHPLKYYWMKLIKNPDRI